MGEGGASAGGQTSLWRMPGMRMPPLLHPHPALKCPILRRPFNRKEYFAVETGRVTWTMVHSSFVPTQPQPLIWHCCLQSSLAFLGQYWVYFGRYRPEAQIGCNKDQQTLRRGDCSFTVTFKFIQNWIDILIIQNCSAGHDSTGNPPAAKQKICSSSSLLVSFDIY